MRVAEGMLVRVRRRCILPLCVVLPALAAEPTAPGLVWVRFNSAHFTRPLDTGIAAQVDVDTGTTFNDYSQIWLGFIELPSDQPVSFHAEADNGLRLFLGDELVTDGWAQLTSRQGVFRGKAGARVALRLEYYQQGGVGHCRLYWQWPGSARELIPASAFCHTSRQKAEIQAMHDGRTKPMQYEDRSIIYQPDQGIPGTAPASALPIRAEAGPHVLLDDYLIAASTGIDRVVLQPRRDASIPNPLVTGPEDRCFQPYLTVLRDPESGRFRIWYGAWRDDQNASRSRLATMASDDGIHFVRPTHLCDTPEIQFGSEVIDRGPAHADPSARYVYSYYLGGGMRLLVSADGLSWRPLVERVVLQHEHDITGIDWDPIRDTYVATVSTFLTGENWSGRRRTTMMSWSTDLLTWEKRWFVLTASDSLDEGQTQFYAMDGYLTRGSLRIGMVKILRDDLRATGTQEGSFGRAHTALAWSRDGRTWVRDRTQFFEPDDSHEAWDHAHDWIDEQLIVDDEVYLYYGGYKQGHKMNRFEERQIGMVKMPLDRYVARRSSGSTPGVLTTVPLKLGRPAGTLQVNADAASGRLRVQVRDADSGAVLDGLGYADNMPITADGLRQSVRWRETDLSAAAGQVVQLDFELTGADLYAFEFARAD